MSSYQQESIPVPTPGRLKRELRLPRPPWWMVLILVLLVIGSWIPLAMAYFARRQNSAVPRVHLILDMDKQPKLGPQASHGWFQDGRGMRLPVAGTIARGIDLNDDLWNLGYRRPDGGSDLVHFYDEMPTRWVGDQKCLERGKEFFRIYCAVCHGLDGMGNGPINQRALELKESKWVPATNLMSSDIRGRQIGQIFQAVSDGVRNMPSYGSQLSTADRWAVVGYLRQLQSQSPVVPTTRK